MGVGWLSRAPTEGWRSSGSSSQLILNPRYEMAAGQTSSFCSLPALGCSVFLGSQLSARVSPTCHLFPSFPFGRRLLIPLLPFKVSQQTLLRTACWLPSSLGLALQRCDRAGAKSLPSRNSSLEVEAEVWQAIVIQCDS